MNPNKSTSGDSKLKKEELTIDIDIKSLKEVKGKNSRAVMIDFSGNCKCSNFCGQVMPGAVDTQIISQDIHSLSARYILKGKDRENQDCSIFIENKGFIQADGSIVTKPVIVTDSKVLSYLEDAKLTGTTSPRENGIIIHIFSEISE